MERPHIRFFARGALAALLALAFVACGGGGGDSGQGSAALNSTSAQAASTELIDAFGAKLSGAEETPPNPSTADGSGTVVVNATTRQMLATVTTSGITGTAAHIHQAPVGQPGPIIIPLSEVTPGSGLWVARATLTEDQFNNLRAGNLYFNVHSAAFPDGEIRGQIASQQSAGSTTVSVTRFISSLKGQQEVPPTPSTAQGTGNLIVNASTRQVAAVVLTDGITGTAAHIHEGPAGVSGPIIVPLREPLAGSGVWIGTGTLSEAQFNSLQQGNLYFNVHSAAFPNGEIRGQILAQQQFTANINPAPSSDTTGGTATPAATPAASSGAPSDGSAGINMTGY
jgi:hypothetical protein